jgi:hypothetical protein
MADEDPSETSTAADSSTPKKETVRITLPPKPEDTPMIKRETVRINAPGVAPKKETTSITGATPLPAIEPAPTPPPPSATRPLVPPPAPRPPSAPMPPGGARPGMPPVAPKPVTAPAPAPKAATYAEAKPVTIKAAPKKETARIQVAPTQKLPPQATVRLSQPTQSLSQAPAPAIRSAPAPAATAEAAGGGSDMLVTILSWVAVAFALGAAALGYLGYST